MCLQRWTDLLFVHWRFPVERVRGLVPGPLEVDPFDGSAWVGAVAFEIRDARIPLVPPGAGLRFPETNLRTYVRHAGAPGVLFLSLDAASRAMVAGGRARYRLPYHRAEMAVERTADEVRYESVRASDPAARFSARARIAGRPGTAPPGTLDHFLVERYALYAVGLRGVRTVRVRHEPYPLRRAEILRLDEGLLSAVGLDPPDRPESARFADRVEAEILETGRRRG